MTKDSKQRLPGWIGIALITVTTGLWVFWGTAELFYEGWGQSFPGPLAYLVPGAICLVLTLVVLRWPAFGGWLIIIMGGGFTAHWFWGRIASGVWSWTGLLSMFPLSGMLVLTGLLFLYEARFRRRLRAEGWTPPTKWLRRNIRYVIALGIPLLVGVGTAVSNLSYILAREDDGYRGARLIEGNGVALVWAPEGPGWNWKQSFGGYPSWNSLARYGLPPVGLEHKPGYDSLNATPDDMREYCLCAYLSEDGKTLMDEPQHIWRLPTTDEIIRSLCLHGENAGCTWDGTSSHAVCRVTPDKETPLWAPDQPPVYYWSADEYDSVNAYYVNYVGSGVWHQPKRWGNPRHGYRCVRETTAADSVLRNIQLSGE